MYRMLNKHNVVAFVHTYQSDGKLDPYMTALVHSFENSGLNIHVIHTNDLVSHLGATAFKPGISIAKIVNFINELDPAFIFTTNRGGITKEILSETTCPIFTRMVDLIPFYHQGGESKDLFCDRDLVFVPTQESVDAFEQRYPVLKGKVHYLPFATDPDAFDALENIEKDIAVSFVGTYFYCDRMTDILEKLQEGDEERRGAFLSFLNALKDNFHVDTNALYNEEIQSICGDFHLSLEDMRMLVSNTYALNKRIHYLDAVADLGLKLFGTANWVQANQFSLPLISCFQFDEQINDRDKLIRLYQRSKIALNISHHQAGAGIPYRVYDIMASSALLITEYHPESELFSLFGKDMPIPMYRNTSELRRLVKYFMENEAERMEIVAKCNALIRKKKLTFHDKARAYCEATGVPLQIGQKGSLYYVDRDRFLYLSISSLFPPVRELFRGVKMISQWVVPYAMWQWLTKMSRK